MSEYRLGIYEKAMPANINWLERLVAAREAGFDFVEISIDETEPRQARLDWTKAECMQLMNTVQITGLPIRTMCLSAHHSARQPNCPCGNFAALLQALDLLAMAVYNALAHGPQHVRAAVPGLHA